MQSLVLNVVTVPVSGAVTLNGSKPTLNCSTKYNDATMQVRFVEVTHGYTFTMVGMCKNSDPFAFEMVLYPGTYKVSVGGYDPYGSPKNASNLPMTKQVVIDKLVIP